MKTRVGNPKSLWDSCCVKDSNSEERAQIFYHLPTCLSGVEREAPRSRNYFYCAILSMLFVLLEILYFAWNFLLV